MSRTIKHGFENELLSVAIAELQATKVISVLTKQGRKYKQILSSIREVGLIEPPIIAPLKHNGQYLLLDGHLRIMALKELGEERISCLISTDDETYTYNKFINNLSAIQENKMLVKALDAGVSGAKLAKTLNIDIRSLQKKKNMLEGVCSEAVELLKDKILSAKVFLVLKKMKPTRQVKVAILMNDQNRYGYIFAKNLLDATPADQLVEGLKSRRISTAVLEKQIRLEEENVSLSEDIRSLTESYAMDILNLTSCQSFLKQIMYNEKVSNFLKIYHPKFFEKFTEIINITILNTENAE